MYDFTEFDRGVDETCAKKRALIEELKAKDPEMGALMEAQLGRFCSKEHAEEVKRNGREYIAAREEAKRLGMKPLFF